jgi:pyruvate,orthophosphate dikinase
MSRLHPLTADLDEPAEVIGAKARGLVELLRLGLPVPPGFVIPAGHFPPDLDLPDLGLPDLGLMAVRSGAAVSMPGMMDTILDVDRDRLPAAVREVFASWHTPRATTYREIHGISHHLGTAVIVQAMVHGDGAGVAYSRNPNTGSRTPYGDIVFGRHGDAVVSGESVTQPLSDLEPAVRDALVAALHRIETHYRDACQVEFAFQAGRLWLLQVRPGGLTGRAAVRVAVDLVDEGLIDRPTALRRVTSRDLRDARAPRIRPGDLLAHGRGACPSVATGRIALTAGRAVRMAAATGMVTSRGGLTSHAAVVARSMGKPAVVGATAVEAGETCARIGDRTLPEGTLITIDGAGGEIVLGDPGSTAAAADPHLRRLLGWAVDRTIPPAPWLDVAGEQPMG